MARYDELTSEVILDQMLNNVRDDVDKRQGSVTYDMLRPTSIEASLIYAELDTVLRLGFMETTEDDYIILKANDVGLERLPAQVARGEVVFYGEEGEEIPQGTRISTGGTDPIYFVTTETVTIDETGSAIVSAEAEEGGIRGNVSAEEIGVVVGDLSDVLSVTNPEPFEGGADEESLESLRERYFLRVRQPGTSGNIYDYQQWAREVPGVGGARVFPTYYGEGTVRIVIIDQEGLPPSETLLEEVETHIEELRPIGADVHIESAVPRSISVDVQIHLENGYVLNNVRNLIEERILDYLSEIAFDHTKSVVSTARIGAIILETEGVQDYENLRVNGGLDNIELEDDETPVLDELTVTS